MRIVSSAINLLFIIATVSATITSKFWGNDFLSNSIDPKDQLQQIANGFWEQANLTDPTTVLGCFDDNATQLTINFFNELSPDLASQQYLKIPDLVLNFQKSLPPATSQCLNSNEEVLQSGEAYGTTNISLAQLLVKIQKYVVFHLSDMHSSFVNMNNDYQAGNYDAYGKDLGVFLQTIMSSDEVSPNIDPKDELQQIANGLWEQVNLTDPTTLLDCFDEDSAQDAITFLDQLNPDIANEQYLKVPALALNFVKNLPPSVTQCLKSNQEVLQCEEAYGTANVTLDDLLKKIQKYVIANLDNIHATFVNLNDEYQAGSYDAYGKDTGALLQAVMGSSEVSPNIDPKDELQQIANGLWEQVNLTDPTTLLDCFDEDSAQDAITFLDQLKIANGPDLANEQYLKVPALALNFVKNLPSSVTQCLKSNQEVLQCEEAYGTANVTLDALLKKIQEYVVANLDNIHATFVTMNNDYQAGNYDVYGKDTGALLQAVMGSSEVSPNIDPKDELQQIANGLWEQVNLTDPTTLLDCFDEDSAQDAITFLDQLNPDIANEQYLKVPALALNFVKNLPSSVTQCLKSNQEVLQCEEAYGTANITLDDLLKQIEKYVIANLDNIHATFVNLNDEYQAGSYDAYGKDTGALLQAVMGFSEVTPSIDPKDELQQIANGLWEQVNLTDPTTIISCFDDKSAKATVEFLGNLNNDLANKDYLKVPTLVLAYKANLPSSVTKCLQGNPEAVQCEDAYGTATITLADLFKKIEAYAIDHTDQIHDDFVNMNTEFQGGQFTAYGKDTGSLLQAVMNYN